ncbi:MAG TPA: hypothetical protein VEZ42_05765 [Pseudonocardia sp.]|nr:hypothetical protein [Pseudonocardia sp.]
MGWDSTGDIVVMLPGITGSVLERDGMDVFGLTVGAGLSALFSAGRSVSGLALGADPVDRPVLDDGVRATRVATDAHLVPGLWKIDGYSAAADYFVRHLRLAPGVDYREFPYDWRRDNRVAATRLRTESERWLHERRRTYPQARLVLLAHSMGGLVARYFLEVLGGWRDTRTLVTFGTPHRGSPNALDYLVNGYRKLFGLVDLSDLMRSFTSVHQLLPIYPCVSINGGPMLRPSELPIALPGLDPRRVKAADEFHREIENAVARNLDDEKYRTHGYALHPVVGCEHRTAQSAWWRAEVLEMRSDYPTGALNHGASADVGVDMGIDMGMDMGGDGTVPRVSATPIELSDNGGEWFSGTRHASLQNAEQVLRQIRHMVVSPSFRLGRFRAMAPVTVSLDLDDVYPPDEQPVIHVRPSTPATDLVVTVQPLTDSGEPTTVEVPLVEEWCPVALPVTRQGCYRVTVTGEDVDPASDVFVVAPSEHTAQRMAG